jgi:hypothetical protein
MDMCQAKSQVPAINIQLMPTTEDQIVQGTTLASVEFAIEGRLCSESVTGMATDIRQTPSLDDFAGPINGANDKNPYPRGRFYLCRRCRRW